MQIVTECNKNAALFALFTTNATPVSADLKAERLRQKELEEVPVDRHSRELLCVQIELFLDYCLRFYDRQFYTRSKVNSDVLQKFEQTLNSYFKSDDARRHGLPSVRYFADKACLSPSYFGDLIKKETGKTAQNTSS